MSYFYISLQHEKVIYISNTFEWNAHSLHTEE